MWQGSERHGKSGGFRHECSEGDGLGPYGWVEHDGVSYGKQEIADKTAGVRLVTSMVKPAELRDTNAAAEGVASGGGLVFDGTYTPNCCGSIGKRDLENAGKVTEGGALQ